LTFITSPGETFTPTRSGAIATIAWECWKEARKHGQNPVVVSRRCNAPAYEGVSTVLVDYPPAPSNRATLLWARLDRKVTGWTYLNQRVYALRLVRAVQRAELARNPMLVFNDPELAVLLRRRFPDAFIAHWFQNQLECKPGARRAFASSVNVACGVSDFTSGWVAQYYGFPAGSVPTLYNGVDPTRFRPAAAPAAGPPVINFVGRTGIEKAPDLLLRAALRVARRTKDFQVQLLGSNYWGRFELDDYQRSLQQYVTELEGLGITVRRPGHVVRADLPGELQKAHINVVPSRWDEPFGLVTLEGMACGLATVASCTGGTPEVVGDAGLLFGRDCEDELADHLMALVTDEGCRRQFAGKGRARAEQFSWEATWTRLCQLIPVSGTRHTATPSPGQGAGLPADVSAPR
jgi:glycosyltransferase involved in cell wall biosynthesis